MNESIFSYEYLTFPLAGIITFFFILYNFWTWNYNYWRDNNVPYLKPSFPFGNTKDYVLSRKYSGNFFGEIYHQLKGFKYGGIINLRTPWLIVRDPEVIKNILTKDFCHFSDRGLPLDEENDPLSTILPFLGGDRWKWLRKKLTPTFSSGKVKTMFRLVKDCGNELDKILLGHAERQCAIELKQFMSRFTSDVISSCAFGLDMDAMNRKDDTFYEIVNNIFKRNMGFIVSLKSFLPGLNKILKLKIIPEYEEKFFNKIVADTVNFREKNQIKRNDFLDLLIGIKSESNHKDNQRRHYNTHSKIKNKNTTSFEESNSSNNMILTNELMTAQCVTFFIAGFETTSSTISFCIYELALNKTIQKTLQDTIDEVLSKHKNDLNYESLEEMKYMDRVIQETLRKYPPMSNLLRQCVADYNLDSKTTIRKGTYILVPLLGLHYDPEYYPEPQRFDPDRFTHEAKAARHHYTWLPFGEGPRVCIGKRFGLLQVKMALAVMLSRYEFDVCPETPIPMEYEPRILLTPKGGIKVKISKRIK